MILPQSVVYIHHPLWEPHKRFKTLQAATDACISCQTTPQARWFPAKSRDLHGKANTFRFPKIRNPELKSTETHHPASTSGFSASSGLCLTALTDLQQLQVELPAGALWINSALQAFFQGEPLRFFLFVFCFLPIFTVHHKIHKPLNLSINQ